MKKILAIILAFTTIIPCCIFSCSDLKKEHTITYENAKQFADEVKELNSKNYDISNRLIISSSQDIDTMGAIDEATGIENVYVLQYDSKDSMQKAYEYYDSLPYVESVEQDEKVISICEDSSDNFDFKAQCISTVNANIDDAIKLIHEENIEFPTITIAIVDTGIAITPITESRFDGGHTYTQYFKEDGTEDINGHGTNVAGTIILNSLDNVRIRSYQAFDENGRANISDVFAQINLAITEGCKIINCSFVSNTYKDRFQKLADYANEMGSLIVCASGNDSKDLSVNPKYPANIENVITVGSTTITNSTSSSTANYGDPLDIYAPGYGLKCFVYNDDGELTVNRWSGTSAATPVISSVCTLFLTVNPKMTYKEMEDLFLLTGNAVDDENCTKANKLVVDAYGAIKYLLNTELEQCTLDYTIRKNEKTNYIEAVFDFCKDAEVWYEKVYSKNIIKPLPEQTLYYNSLYDNSAIQAFSIYGIDAYAFEPHKAKSNLNLFMLPLYNSKKDYEITKSTSEDENNTIKQCCILDKATIEVPSVIDDIEIQEIGPMCFAGNKAVETVILPRSITKIDEYAFANCPNLKTVIAPGVTECKHAAFYGSDKLENVTIPKLSTANTALFKNCSSLKYLQCKPLTKICNQAFYGCKSLESLKVDKNDFSFCTNTFYGCDKLILTVTENSYMHEFAVNNNIPFAFSDTPSESACSHNNVEIIKDIKKDCYTDGYTVYSCLDCNCVYTVFDYCTGHDYIPETIMPTCTDYKQIKHQCKNCPYYCYERIGNYLVPHNTYTVVYLEPTILKTGRAYTYCKNCDTELPDTIIPSLAPYTVKGKTVVAEDRNFTSNNNYPLSNVSVTVNDELVAVTDENGEFNINLDSGSYTAHLTHPSGFDKTIEFTVENNSVTIAEPIPLIACDWHKDGVINAKDYAKLKNTDSVYGYDFNGNYLIDDTEKEIFKNCLTY